MSVFGLDGCEVVAVLVRASVVEPVDPFGGGELDEVKGAPGAAWFDQLGLVEPVDRLREGIVIASGPDRGVNAGVDEPFGERDRGVLEAGNLAVQWSSGLVAGATNAWSFTFILKGYKGPSHPDGNAALLADIGLSPQLAIFWVPGDKALTLNDTVMGG